MVAVHGPQGEKACPHDFGLIQDIKTKIEKLTNTLAMPPKQPPWHAKESCCKEKLYEDICCENLWSHEGRQQYKVTISGEVVGPLWPPVPRKAVMCPPCLPKQPAMHPTHGCYSGPTARETGIPKKKRYMPRPLAESDCQARNFFSACQPHRCPPQQRHWHPECSTCRYPNSCKADCTNHPPCNDWVYRQPSYRHYLQKRHYKPFMRGF